MIIDELRSLRWADFFLFALTDPRALYRIINRDKPRPFLLSFAVPAMVAVTDIISFSLLGRETTFFYFKLTYGWILLFLYLALKVVIVSALMDMAAQFIGYRGNIREFISLVNFSLFPKVFILPLVYIFTVLNFTLFSFAPVFFYLLFSLALFIWSAAIAVQGISEMHSADFGRSLAIYLFPLVMVGVTLFFIFILLMIGATGFLFG